MAKRDDAERLLARMARKKAGWSAADLASLYDGFGFARREGGNYTIYEHPRYPELTATVSRHPGDLPSGYVRDAVKLIRRLIELEGVEENDEDGN